MRNAGRVVEFVFSIYCERVVVRRLALPLRSSIWNTCGQRQSSAL